MTIQAPTLFAFRHDWGTPFQVTREWKTDVQQADDGSEVRVQLRATPNISCQFSLVFATEMPAGKLLADWRTAAQPLRFYVPLWCDATDLIADVTAGDAIISLDTTTRPFFAAPGFAMLFRDEFHAELVSYSEVDDTLLILDAGTASSYAAAGTRVVPCRIMWMQLPVAVAWKNGRIETATVSFIDEKAQAAFQLADTPTAPVVTSVEIYRHSNSNFGTNNVGQRTFFVEAVGFDSLGIPVPSAVFTWSVHNNEMTGSITVTPSVDSHLAIVVSASPSCNVTATCGSVSHTMAAA